MESFLASRPSIAKLSVQPKTTANLFASLANRTTVRPTASPVASAPAAAAPTDHRHEAQVELIREDGVVQRIIVVCPCGERIELDCVY